MRLLAICQGIFYFLTGVWPLVSITTFQMVTGPKTDLWLVKTVGALISIIGIGLLLAGLANEVSYSIFVIAAGSAFSLAFVDVWYSGKGTISKIYLLDAVVEAFIITCWFFVIL